MATEWGLWEGTSPERFRVGIDLEVSSTTITERYYVEYEGSSINDNQTLTVSGARSEVMNFTNTTAGVTLVATRSLTGSYNTEYTYTADLTGTYTGATPSHTRAITVPYERPGVPGTPSMSSIAGSTATASWTAPSFWGGHNSGWYDFQWWVENQYSATNQIVGVTTTSYGLTGLTPGVTYICRVRAKNNAPDSPGDWSGQRTFTMVDYPSAPGTPTVSNVLAASFDMAWTAPSDDGGGSSALSYDWQVASDSGFSTITASGSTGSLSASVSGQTVGSTRYARVRAVSAAGAGGWSGTRTVVLDSVPTAPGTPSTSSVSQSGFTASWGDPSSWGGDDTSQFDVQIDDNSGFSSPSTYSVTGNSRAFSGLSPNVTYYVRVRAKNGAGVGPWSGTKSQATLPDPPAAPSAVAGARVSDTQHTVSWTRNATAAAPYSSQQVQRAVFDGSVWGAWGTIATVSGTATSYSDTGTIANRAYKWRVVAVNSAGSTASAESAVAYTTPASPSSAAAAKTAGGDISVTWTESVLYSPADTQVEHSADGGAWSVLATVGVTTTQYTHVAPSTAQTHQYRVRHRTTIMSPQLFSGYSTSGTVSLAAPPNAPTSLAPSGVVLDAAGDITLTWMHNPTDSSPQSQYQVRYRVDGGSWVELTAVVSATSSHVIAGGTWTNGTGVEWQVRTWGEHPTVSAYSATASLTMSTTPTVTINSPADAAVLVTSTATVEWGYVQAEGSAQSQWRITLIEAGATVESLSGTGAATSATFATAVQDGGTYTIRAEVRSTAGLWSVADEVTVTVDYLPPEDVVVSGVYDSTSGVVVLTLTPQGETAGVTLAAVAVDILRRVDGGAWVEIASQVSPDATVLDTQPGTRATNEYQVLIWSALPSTVYGAGGLDAGVAVVTDERRWAFLSYGPGFATVLRCYGNLSLGSGASLDQALEHFVGQDYPTLLVGEAKTRALTADVTLDDDSATVADFEAAALAGGTMLWRDPSGRRVFVALTGISASADTLAVASLSLSMRQVEHDG